MGEGEASVHKCSGMDGIKKVGAQSSPQTPPWGQGGLQEEVTASAVLNMRAVGEAG